MIRKIAVAIAFSLAVCTFVTGGEANAAWPSGGVRVTSGKACRASGATFYCPFVSDYDTYYGASNSYIYVDYNVSAHTSGSVINSACRQSWTGASAACGSTSTTSTTGYQDVGVAGFSTISGSPDVYDSFYVQMIATDTVSIIYGVSFV